LPSTRALFNHGAPSHLIAMSVFGIMDILKYFFGPGLQPRLRVLESGSHLDQVRTAAPAVQLPITTGEDWAILWSYRTAWESDVFKGRKSSGRLNNGRTIFNHIPGTLSLASKAHLPGFVRSVGLGDAIPRSFLLPEEHDRARSTLTRDGVLGPAGWPRWIIKSKKHRGIKVLQNATEGTLAAFSPAIVQRRVEPLLLSKVRRAFDIGLYVLVTSVRPLRVYVYDQALVRFCEKEFPTTAAGFANNEASYVIKNYAPIWTLPPFERALRACNDSAACALRTELKADGHDADLIWRRMEGLVGRLLSALLDKVQAGLARLELADEAVFELFRFDFLVNDEGAPVLTEVNISPNLVPAYKQDGRVKAALVRDSLRLAALRLRPSKASSATEVADLAATVDGLRCYRGCCRFPLRRHLERELVGMASELQAASSRSKRGPADKCLTAAEMRALELSALEAKHLGGFRRLKLASNLSQR